MKLYTQIQGEGPPLVLLHGWGFSHLVWQDLMPKLSERYRVINIDLPGFGQSPFANTIHSLKSLAEAVLIEIPESAIVMGWSLGGLIAQYLAIHHPKQIKALIVVASTPCFIQHDNWPGMSEALLNSFAKELVQNYQKILRRFLVLQFFGLEVDHQLIKKLTEQIIQQKPEAAALHLGLDLLLNSDLRSELHKINCPIKFILGKLDVIVPAKIAEKLPVLNSKINIEVIKSAGHAPFISHPEAFLAASGLLL